VKPDYKKIIEKYLPYCKQNIFVIIGIIGIVLISIGDFNFPDRNKSDETVYSLEDYCCQLETEMTELLREIEGVGEVKVMITMESGEENIYVEQEKSAVDNRKTQTDTDIQENTQSTYENEIVIVSAQNNNQPLIEKTVQPTVKGVAVVCSGADDIYVVSDVINTVSVVLNVSTNRIYVTKMR